jgi:hypothetical protein
MTTDPHTLPDGPCLVLGLLSDGRERPWTLPEEPCPNWLAAVAAACRFERNAALSVRTRDPRCWGGWVPGSARVVTLADWRSTQ